MFDIKTPSRIWYLAADNEEEMSKWVSLVCSACGLKSSQEDEEDENGEC